MIVALVANVETGNGNVELLALATTLTLMALAVRWLVCYGASSGVTRCIRRLRCGSSTVIETGPVIVPALACCSCVFGSPMGAMR